MAKDAAVKRKQSLAYNIFILALTILSLAIMVLLLLPFSAATITLLQFYDNLICVIFLLDFAITLRATRSKSDFFLHERGWLDLLGSIPPSVWRPNFPRLLSPGASAAWPGSPACCAGWNAEVHPRCRREPQPIRLVHHAADRIYRLDRRQPARAPI